MKKLMLGLFVVLMLAAVGCGSAPEPKEEKATVEIVEPEIDRPVFVDHKNLAFGGDIPSWVTTDEGALEKLPEYDGLFVFRFEATGEDLQGVQLTVDNLQAAPQIARMISLRVQQKFAGAQVGDNNFVETYFENVVKVLAEAEVSGYRKYGDYWVLRQWNDGRQDYLVRTLYTMSKDAVEDLIDAAVSGQSADTEEEQTAKDLVRGLLDEGI